MMNIIFYIALIFTVSVPILANEFIHFPRCNEPGLVVTTPTAVSTKYATDFFCERNSPLPSLGEMDDFIANFSSQVKHQKTRFSFLSDLSARLRFITSANKKKLEIQKKCFIKGPKPQGCNVVRTEIFSGIKDNWHEMSLSMVLGFQDNSAVRYQFGAREPDLFQFSKTKHPFGGKVIISDKIKVEANEIFKKKKAELGNKIDSGLRDQLQSTYSQKYTQALSRAPIMAMVDSSTPSDKDIRKALDMMIQNNEDLLNKKFSASELSGFYPLMNDLVKENPNFCTIAEHLVTEKLKRDDNKRYIQIGAAGVLGVGCLASAWTGVGMSLCFASGAIMTGTNIKLTNQNASLERMRAFTGAIDNQLVSDFDALSEAEQEFALELAMAPLAGFGAGHLLKAVAPSTRVLNFVARTKNARLLKAAKSLVPNVDDMSETALRMQDDVAKVRAQYKNSEEVNVCGINVGSLMCRDNIQELLRYAKARYADFDMSRARVIKIEADEYVPLYANNTTRPTGYSVSTMNGVEEFSNVTRTAEDGATTWSRHFVLEYEGRIYDFDHAGDVALPTARYFESQFQDAVTGVVKPSTTSRYNVQTIDAAEYTASQDISRYSTVRVRAEEVNFLDFYRSLPETNTSIVPAL